MAEFFANGAGLLLLSLFFAFYWVPFAVGAYVADIWYPERERRRHAVPVRHMPPEGPATPTPA